MIAEAVTRLEELAQSDATVAPLALLQAEAGRATRDSTWDEGVAELDGRQLQGGFPLLHRQTLRADRDLSHRLLESLAAVAVRSGREDAEALRSALGNGTLEPLAVLEAGIAQDGERLDSMAVECGLDLQLLATLAQLATFPLLQACGRKAAPLLEGVSWEAGCCPVCAAWPTLAELRGLDRHRRLRCGRCGADWALLPSTCPFCAKDTGGGQAYLAAEDDRESRRAVICDNCQSYLKTLTTFSAVPAADIAFYDLTSLELDMAALEKDYGRPQTPGFPLQVSVEPLRRRTLWTPWGR